jgi:glycine/serine hydroxymethyltransferase
MIGQAQVTSHGFDTIKLNSNIYEYMGITAFQKFKDQNLFSVDEPENFYNVAVPVNNHSTLCIKYIFAQTDADGQIKRITLFIDDSENNALELLKKTFGNEHTTAQSSIGKANGNIFYGWVTEDKTFILMAKTDTVNKSFGIPMSSIDICKQSDLDLIAGKNIRVKLPNLLF